MGAAPRTLYSDLIFRGAMGYFYFDETIQERGGFIIGAFIYTEEDITPDVYSAIEQVGLQPGIDEYKSGSRMDRNPRQAMLRIQLSQSLRYTKVGLVVLPANERALLGNEAIIGLQKILRANKLDQIPHKVFVDEGIAIDSDTQRLFLGGAGSLCELYTSQDSRIVGGLQMADFVAHSLGGMLLEQLGLIAKKVRAGEGSGYDPDLEIELGFELWASLRYQFFKAPQPNPGPIPDDPVGELIFDVANYGLHISDKCSPPLREAAYNQFGGCYLGCIH